MNKLISKPLLKLENVSLYAKLANRKRLELQGQAILQDITLTIPQSALVAIVGASGSGKSFLLRLINRLSEPSHGKIFWEDTPYSQISPLDLRQRVVLAPQVPKLLGMNVEDALKYPLQLRRLDQNTIEQRLAYWLPALQIPDDWRGKNELQLSTGQIQLIAIARALVTQPQVLLLDEPTAHLDLRTANRLMEVLNQAIEKHNITIIMVNHQLELIQKLSNRPDDQLIHLQAGRIIEQQTAMNLNWDILKTSIVQAEHESEW